MTRWLSEYGIGVKGVDAEHQGLFALAEKLHKGIVAGMDREIVRRHLDELVDQTCLHFVHEEELMKRIGYPHYPDHCREHRELRAQAFSLRDRYAAGEMDMALELLQFVTDWFKCHTTTSDRRIGSYMRRYGLVE